MKLRTLKVEYNFTINILLTKLLHFLKDDLSYSEFEEYKSTIKDLSKHMTLLLKEIKKYEDISMDNIFCGFPEVD